MRNVFLFLWSVVIGIFLLNHVFAEDLTLTRRSSIQVNAGLWSGSQVSNTVSASGVQAEVKTNAFVGGVLFTHWMNEYLALTAGAGVLSSRVSSTVTLQNTSQHVSSVVPVLFGVRVYSIVDDQGDVRPYLSAAIGSYIGSEVSNTIYFRGAHTETALSGRIGAGVDFFVSNHFKLDANLGYNLMSDFDIPVGARRNYNGGDFSFGLGYVF